MSSLSVPGRFDVIDRPPAGRSLTPYGVLVYLSASESLFRASADASGVC
jgi:hypothetical protein